MQFILIIIINTKDRKTREYSEGVLHEMHHSDFTDELTDETILRPFGHRLRAVTNRDVDQNSSQVSLALTIADLKWLSRSIN